MVLELTPKQTEYILDAHHHWNFAIGAVRSGKSFLAIQYLIPNAIVEGRGKKGINIILGATRENIERNVLAPMREIWEDVCGINCISEINSRNMCSIFGEKVYCIGAENKSQVSRIRGTEIKFCYCDEICDISQEVFDMLKSRLSLPYSICHAAANPSYPEHFVKKFLDSKEKGVDIYCQKYTLYDNPFLPEDYVRNLEIEYAGTVYYLRYILGEWTKAEGLIWPMYDTIIEEPPDIKTTDRAISIDYGTQNPFAMMYWEKKGEVWYATKGYYYSGRETGKQKTDADYGDDIDQFVATDIKERDELEEKSGIPQPKIRVIIDPSAASFIALLKRKPWCRVIPADNAVLDGIRETATAMQKGKIKVSPSLKEWREEASGYVWDESTEAEERPVKENDHYMDATRYFVKTMKLIRYKREYTPIWS